MVGLTLTLTLALTLTLTLALTLALTLTLTLVLALTLTLTRWANASSRGAPATRVSMRFLRGLDAHKLEHNSKAWRELEP